MRMGMLLAYQSVEVDESKGFSVLEGFVADNIKNREEILERQKLKREN